MRRKGLTVTAATIAEKRLKATVKAALVEVLEERKDLVVDLFEEALLDIGLARAIREGERTPAIGRERVLAALGAKS